MSMKLSRRHFLQSAASAGAMFIAVANTPRLLAEDEVAETIYVTSCLRLDPDGGITLCVPVPDMGQGMETTAAQIIAEELDVRLEAVKVELMHFQGKFNSDGRAVFDRFYQGAGGSGSTMRVWNELRRTAAYARALLVEAACEDWQVAADHVETSNARALNTITGATLEYATLVPKTQRLGADIVYGNQQLKPDGGRRVVGQDSKNVRARDIVTGKPLFGIDAAPDGILHAVIVRCPHIKGGIRQFDASVAETMPGVQRIISMRRQPDDVKGYRLTAAGIAVVADTYWQARKAADQLTVDWDGAVSVEDDTARFREEALKIVRSGEMQTAVEAGDLGAAFEVATTVHEATYFHPHWAHACMEPHSCVADIREEDAEIWVSHQFLDAAINAVTNAVGTPADKVKAHFYRMGTGFGRKFEEDFIAEACILSKEMRSPVKVTWSREDEMEQDYCNSLVGYQVRGAVDENGELTAWHMRAAGDTRPVVAIREFPVGLVDTYKGEWHQIPNLISRGAWRGPHHNVAAWVIQSFLNELAYKSGRDPLEFLLSLYARKSVLKSKNWPYRDIYFDRHIAVLKQASEAAGYGEPMPKGWGRGVAVHHTFVSTCAHVVDVEITDENSLIIHKVTSAVDCGYVVNPLGARAQIESGIHDGICSALHGEFRFEAGVPVTNNFDSYRKMRIDQAPREIDIHFVDRGDTEPRGTGEVGLPPVIPALTNAIFAASGKRIRELPISKYVA